MYTITYIFLNTQNTVYIDTYPCQSYFVQKKDSTSSIRNL